MVFQYYKIRNFGIISNQTMSERAIIRPKYDIQKPPEGYSAVIDWVLGSDVFTNQLIERLGYSPSNSEIEFSRAIANRDPNALNQVTEIWGRSAKARSPRENTILETRYNTLEIGGFGFQRINIIGGAAAQVDLKSPISIPSGANFSESYPSITQTVILEEGKTVVLGDAYSFTGAYTQKQAIRKVAANLFILNKLAYMPHSAFVVPVPIAVGHYPMVMDAEGNPAYFVVFNVPYDGKRTGISFMIGGDVERYKRFGNDLVEAMPGIACTLALISNQWGLIHNQPHPANLYIPKPGEGKKPFLADFSTLYPLKPIKQEVARAHELSSGMMAVWNMLTSNFQSPSEYQIVSYIFGETLKNYFGSNLSLPGGPESFKTVELFFEVVFKAAIERGLIPRSLPYRDSWDKILDIEKDLLKQII